MPVVDDGQLLFRDPELLKFWLAVGWLTLTVGGAGAATVTVELCELTACHAFPTLVVTRYV